MSERSSAGFVDDALGLRMLTKNRVPTPCSVVRVVEVVARITLCRAPSNSSRKTTAVSRAAPAGASGPVHTSSGDGFITARSASTSAAVARLGARIVCSTDGIVRAQSSKIPCLM